MVVCSAQGSRLAHWVQHMSMEVVSHKVTFSYMGQRIGSGFDLTMRASSAGEADSGRKPSDRA